MSLELELGLAEPIISYLMKSDCAWETKVGSFYTSGYCIIGDVDI